MGLSRVLFNVVMATGLLSSGISVLLYLLLPEGAVFFFNGSASKTTTFWVLFPLFSILLISNIIPPSFCR